MNNNIASIPENELQKYLWLPWKQAPQVYLVCKQETPAHKFLICNMNRVSEINSIRKINSFKFYKVNVIYP